MSEREAGREDARDEATVEPIAIVGIGCRYADARGPEEFWEIVRSGRNTVRDAPEHRIELGYDIDHFYDPRPRIPGKISSKKGGFLEHPELFDPKPFGIAPRDALTMEPQQRLMVEVTWDALEDAGIIPENIAGERVAVILGYMAEDYSRERAGVLGEAAVYRGHDVFTVGGMSHAVLSGRIAFLLGVTGPSFTLDTACSSSLIATHLACQSIRRGESDMALAGGVNLFLSPEGNIALSRSGMLSMSGACKAFDASADGFVRAEGAGVVVLKRLSDAMADENPIYAVIRGSGISTDGRDGGHMMAPGRGGQAQAMRDAYAEARIDPARVQYVETHGTGTMIGDPVEIGALADVMGPGRDPDQPLRVASVKGNLGHTESASGVAGLIKACLSIRHRTLPAQLHFETPNPMIPWDEIPVEVQTEMTDWPAEGPALVGVNSFGISGTNAHVILESPPDQVPQTRGKQADPEATRPLILPITAHDANALHDLVAATRDRMKDRTDREIEDLVHTFATRRLHRAHRAAFIAGSPRELVRELDAYLEGEPTPATVEGVAALESELPVVMVFPGQGGQWLGMGQELMRSDPDFAASIARLDEAYARHVDWSLREVLLGESGFDFNDRLDVLQPVLVAVEIALAEAWAKLGVRPDSVIGQSMGEIAAAHIGGHLDLEDMARLVTHRGAMVARASGAGAMAVVSLSREEIAPRLAGRENELEIAGVNSPRTTIVAGDAPAVAAFVAAVEAEGHFARRLEVDFASHCFHMDPLVEDFAQGIRGLRPRDGSIDFHSTVDGERKDGSLLGADYWVRNLRSPVALDRGLASVFEAGPALLLEVSPHPSLPRAIDETARECGATATYVPTLVRDESEPHAFARHFAGLFVAGASVDWSAWSRGGRVTRLPLYPYQRERYWFSKRSRLDNFRPKHPLLGAASDSSLEPRLRSWDFVYDEDAAGFVSGCRVGSDRVAPAGFFVELARAAAFETWPEIDCALVALQLARPLAIEPDGRARVQVALRREGEGRGTLWISSRSGDDESEWIVHASCALSPTSGKARERSEETRQEVEVPIPLSDFDRALERCGRSLSGPAKTVREIGFAPTSRADDRQLVAKLMLPRSVEAEWHAYHLHPALLEGAMQAASLLLPDPRALTVLDIERVAFEGGLGSDCFVHVHASAPADESGISTFDFAFVDREGKPLGELRGHRARPNAVTLTDARATSETLGLSWCETVVGDEIPAPHVARWVIISDDADEAELFATELRKRGDECRFCEKPEDLGPLGEQMNAGDAGAWGLVILAWGQPPREAATEPALHRAFRIGSWAEALRAHATRVPEVWIATRGLVDIDAAGIRPTLVGARIAREIDAFTNAIELDRCRFFDASRDLASEERRRLASIVGVPADERCYAARSSSLFVERLIALPESVGAGGIRREARNENFVLARSGVEARSGAALVRRADEPPLAEGEVRVEVRAVGLGELDVLVDLGLIDSSSSSRPDFGQSVAGVVIEVGEAVAGVELGMGVLGVASGTAARRLALDARDVVPLPVECTMAAGAGLIFPVLVARHVLDHAARISSGERILIDLDARVEKGALVRLARGRGAEVSAIATGAESDRDLERAGAKIVSRQARDPSFDIVVSDRTGADRDALVERLGRRGRYVDLRIATPRGRTDETAISLGRGRSFTVVDEQDLLRDDASWRRHLMNDMAIDLEMAGGGAIGDAFAFDEAGRALRFVGQRRSHDFVSLALESAETIEIESKDVYSGVLAHSGRIVISGGDCEYKSRLRESLAGAFEGDIEIVEGDSADDVISSVMSHERAMPALWIHVAEVLASDRVVYREAMSSLFEGAGVFLVTRPACTGDPVRDRAWENQLFSDGLGGPGSGVLDLSVSDTTVPNELVPLLAMKLAGASLDSPIILMNEEEQRQRSASPMLARVLGSAVAKRVEHRPEELAAMSRTDRRSAMTEIVTGELAGVLGMDESQRETLEPASSLDRVGLDSLMTLELFMGLSRQLELEIAADWFESIPTIGEIAETLGDRLTAGAEKGAA